MTDRVAIIAVAQTPYEAPNDTWRSHELTSHAVEKVLNETGLEFTKDGKGIDATITCSNWRYWIRTDDLTGVIRALQPTELMARKVIFEHRGGRSVKYYCEAVRSGRAGGKKGVPRGERKWLDTRSLHRHRHFADRRTTG